jgi:hypothetical protein
MNRKTSFLLIAIFYQIVISLTVLVLIYLNHKQDSLDWILTAWDAHHYQYIAQYGYQTIGDEANFIVFFPLYPILIRIVSFFIPNFVIASLVVSFIFSILAHYVVMILIDRLDIPRYTKFLSIILFFISPISVYFLAPYTESVYLFFISAFFYLLLHKRYCIATLCAFFAALSRNVGILLLIPFGIQLLINEKRGVFKYIPLTSLIIIAPLLYLGINYYLWGDPFYFQTVLLSNWHKEAINPINNIIMLIKDFPNYLKHDIYTYVIDFFSIPFLFFLIVLYLIKKLLILKKKIIPIPWILWMIANWLVVLSQSFLLSSARYLFILFPVYIMLPELLPENKILKVLITVPLLGIFMYLSIHGLYLYAVGAWIY